MMRIKIRIPIRADFILLLVSSCAPLINGQRLLSRPGSKSAYEKGAAARGKRKTQRSAPLRMAFSAQARILDGGPRDQFPCAQTLFEHALHVRMTSFPSVDDILKAVREKGRRDLRHYHLAFAIRTDFYGRHHGTS